MTSASAPTESRVTITTEEGGFGAFVAYPAGLPAPSVIVLHEIFGVNDDIRTSCRELAQQGFIAVAPDLFWRHEPGLDLNSWSELEWKKGLAIYQAYDLEAGVRDVTAAAGIAAALPGASGKVGVMGYCLGGLLTYLVQARSPVDAGVAYYGGATEQHLDDAKGLEAPLMMHLGEDDEYISAEAQTRIRAALQDRPGVIIHGYAGQSHAFARHTGTHYDEPSATLANGRTFGFLRDHLG